MTPKKIKAKPDDLIPPDSELGQQLAQWAEDADAGVWNIANTCNELIEELKGGPITRKQIYAAVAARCKGRKPNTIRRWAECAAAYDVDTRTLYAPLLSFEHFKVNRRLFAEGYTPDIEYGLAWCVSGDDYKVTAGRFHTAGEMLNHFVPEYRQLMAVRAWEKSKEDIYDDLLLIDNDTDRERALEAWKVIEYVLDKNKKQVVE